MLLSLFDELKRRDVPRVAVAYLATAWLVVQVAETLFPIFGRPEAAARVVVVILAIGFVPVLVLSWVYRWTPEGFRLDRMPDGPETGAGSLPGAAHEGTRRLDRLIIVTLTLAVGYFAVDKFLLDPVRDARLADAVARKARAEAVDREYGQRSIAVLAFRSSDPDKVPFAQGVSEELLHTLGGIPELRVAAAGSAFSLSGAGITTREIGEALNVTYLLEGSVRTAGDSVRITARLVDATTDTQLWTRTLDRRLEDVFAIQDEIARSVVSGLEVVLLDTVPRTRQTNPETYRLYLQAQYLLRTGRDVGEEAEELLSRALELDADYVPAMLALARVYNRLAFEHGERYRQLTRAMVDRALAIEPENGYAIGWLGWIAIFYDRDREAGARYTERSFALDPTNLDLVHGVQQIARMFGLLEEAITLGRYETVRDPICARCWWQLGHSYLVAGELDAAEEALRTAERLDPRSEDLEPALDLGLIELERGDAAAALAEFERLLEDSPSRQVGVALASHALGRRADFEAAVASLAAREDATRWLAPIHAFTGDADAALAALEANWEAGWFTYRGLSMAADPIYQGLHADRRWETLLRERGDHPAQLAAIDFRLEIPPVITQALE